MIRREAWEAFLLLGIGSLVIAVVTLGTLIAVYGVHGVRW